MEPNGKLIEDLEQRLGTHSLLEWVEQKTVALARLGWRASGWIDFSRAMLDAVGVAAVTASKTIRSPAMIRPGDEGRYEVLCHTYRPEEDRRFWIAHEICHTFWFRPGGKGVPLSPRQNSIGGDETIEWLCNRGAAALLLPRALLRRRIEELGGKIDDEQPRLAQIFDLASMHRTPVRLTARRWFHDILDRQISIICIELADDCGRILWEALPSEGQRAKKLQGRIVPLSAIPSSALGRTERISLDGRWRELVRQTFGAAPTVPFSRIRRCEQIVGYAVRVERSVVIAF